MIRVGIVGLGMAVTPHAKSLLDLADRVEVAAAYQRPPDRAHGVNGQRQDEEYDRSEASIGKPLQPGKHTIQGIGAGFIPAVLNTQIYDEVIAVSDEDAALYTRRLALEEGVLVGISSGAACCAALKVAKTLGKGHVVVTLFADKGEHYLSTEVFSNR